MAKVKIQGHASGTGILTVTAPNTSTDRTITLPDGTGTLALTTGDDDKLPLAGGTLTGNLVVNTASPNVDMIGTGTSHASTDYITNSNAVRATVGVERAAGGGLFVGSSAYAAVFGTASSGATEFATNNTVRMSITSDGRGLSQFTAKAWAFFNGTGTPALADSHNCSSITDMETGIHRVNFSNALGNTDFVVNYTTMNETSNSNCNTSVSTTGKSTTCSGNLTKYENNSLADPSRGSIVVFGD